VPETSSHQLLALLACALPNTNTCHGFFTGKLTVAGDNAYVAYINGQHVISDARAAGNDNMAGCDDTTVNWLGDTMSGCNWQVRPA
jgi:hypothetical protein